MTLLVTTHKTVPTWLTSISTGISFIRNYYCLFFIFHCFPERQRGPSLLSVKVWRHGLYFLDRTQMAAFDTLDGSLSLSVHTLLVEKYLTIFSVWELKRIWDWDHVLVSRRRSCWGGILETLTFQRLKHAVFGTKEKGCKVIEVLAQILMKSCSGIVCCYHRVV